MTRLLLIAGILLVAVTAAHAQVIGPWESPPRGLRPQPGQSSNVSPPPPPTEVNQSKLQSDAESQSQQYQRQQQNIR